jgi:hypothetical protein
MKLFLQFLIAIPVLFAWLTTATDFYNFFQNTVISFLAGLVVYSVVYFILFILVDPIIFWLESIPGINMLFQWSFTKEYRRYIAEGFKPNAQVQEDNTHEIKE